MFSRKVISLSVATAIVAFTHTPSVFAADPKDDQFSKQMDDYLQKDENVEKVGKALERFFQKKRDEMQKAAKEQESKALEDQFKNPVQVDVGTSPVKGKADAPVTIVAFSDFQCPFCKSAAGTIAQVEKAYPDKVKIAFKNLPLPFHEHAKPAAIAALAANKQGKFWEMHDLLFANQQDLSDEKFVELAKQLGLDQAKFKADLADPAIAKQIEEDSALANKLGVRGTPGFFVNGVEVKGAKPFPEFKQIIDRWLEQKGKA